MWFFFLNNLIDFLFKYTQVPIYYDSFVKIKIIGVARAIQGGNKEIFVFPHNTCDI